MLQLKTIVILLNLTIMNNLEFTYQFNNLSHHLRGFANKLTRDGRI